MIKAAKALPTVVLVEAEADLCVMLKRYLTSNDFHVVTATNAEQTRDWVLAKSIHPRVLVLSQHKQSIDQLVQLGHQIRQQEGFSNETAILVLAEPVAAEHEDKTVQISEHEYVLYLEDGQQLITLLNRLCSQEADNARAFESITLLPIEK